MKKMMVVLLVFVTAAAFGQKKSLSLEGSIQAGLLEGELGSAFQLQATGGLKLGTWSTAIGAGLDYYGVRSVPVFLNVQKRLFDRPQTPFVYISGGYHFAWSSRPQMDVWRSWVPEGLEKKGGIYYSAGLGYQLPAFKKAALFFTAGYSFKRYREMFNNIICPFMGPCFDQSETTTYQFRRVSITTGLRF